MNKPQDILNDLFNLGMYDSRKPSVLPENRKYLSYSELQKEQYLAKLVKNGANPDKVFFNACAGGTDKEVEVLISLGANINIKHEQTKATPLISSIIHDRPNRIHILLKHNADVHIDYNGLNPLLLAIKCEKTSLIQKIKNSDLFSIDNYPNKLFLHEITQKKLITRLLGSNEGRAAFSYYMTQINYNPLEKDENKKTVFDYLKVTKELYKNSEQAEYLNKLKTQCEEQHLSNKIKIPSQNKSTIKV